MSIRALGQLAGDACKAAWRQRAAAGCAQACDQEATRLVRFGYGSASKFVVHDFAHGRACKVREDGHVGQKRRRFTGGM